jgi:putative transposase
MSAVRWIRRSTGRATPIERPADYQQSTQVLQQARMRADTRTLARGLTPNHGHLVLWPEADGMLVLTPTQRW